MNGVGRSIWVTVLLVVLFGGRLDGHAQANRFVLISQVKARPLAMGGAFTSIEGDLGTIGYNPAALSLYRFEKEHRVTLFLNPLGAVVGGVKRGELFPRGGFDFDDLLLTAGLFVKSIVVTLNSFEFGLLLGEQSLDLPEEFVNEEPFNVSGLRQNHAHSFVGRIKLAEKIALGGTASMMRGSLERDPQESFKEITLSYGILLKPEKSLNIGVSFVNLPDSLKNARWPVERFVDESVNVGVSYRPFSSTILSMDVRNLGEEENRAVREFHFGLEQVVFSQVALRAGYYSKNQDGDFVISGGVGLINGNTLFDVEDHFSHPSFYLNYAFVYDSSFEQGIRWHLLSLRVRI